MSQNVKPIPDGYPAVAPYLIISGAARALEFYKEVFGAKERMRLEMPGGVIGHAEIQLGDSVVMMADELPQMGIQGPESPRRNTPTTRNECHQSVIVCSLFCTTFAEARQPR